MAAEAFVRVSGPPNSNFLKGYPGISATLPRIEGRVEIRPLTGISAPVSISLVRICLVKRETIHPSAESIAKKHLGTPRKEISDLVGKELLLFRCSTGKVSEKVVLMDLPFVIFIPFGKGGLESNRRIPPASLQLPSRTAETFFELVVTVQQGQEQKRFAFPVPIQRYDTLSTFGMYNRPESAEKTKDHLVTLGISLPRCSYGPLDPVSVYVKVSPNPDWISKARKVIIQKITVSIEEEITFNPEGDEPSKKVKEIAKHTQQVGVRLPEGGYLTNLGLIFPSKDPRNPVDGFVPRGKAAFPMHSVTSFTTSSTLYKIDFFLRVKAHLSGARDIALRHLIVVCPIDHQDCSEEMGAIEQAAKDAAMIDPQNPMLPAPTIIKANDPNALQALGWAIVGGLHKMLID
ncbi:hypothetical protein K3495_g10868 [Podosphaera aphanis]|nr:hypothetical protein K3495_g10868 [Podosphaera aphanis]